jgi:hypothetical protein
MSFFSFGSRFFTSAGYRPRQVLAGSARNPRVPHGCKLQNILGRVLVAVVVRTAITGPFTDLQRHRKQAGSDRRDNKRQPCVAWVA